LYSHSDTPLPNVFHESTYPTHTHTTVHHSLTSSTKVSIPYIQPLHYYDVAARFWNGLRSRFPQLSSLWRKLQRLPRLWVSHLFFLTSCRYASHSSPFVPIWVPGQCSGPFHQPVVDLNYASFPQQVAQANETLPLGQAEHAGPQYPCQHNPWDHATPNVYRPGGFNLDAGSHDPLNFAYDGIATEPVFPMASMAPVWDFDNNQNFEQLDMSIPAGAQLNPAPYPAMVSAPPAPAAPVPAPAPAAADRIRCPHGCPATFGRGGEYRRHMMNHGRPRYRCPMFDCPKTFSRADKLRDHAKKGHGGNNPLNL